MATVDVRGANTLHLRNWLPNPSLDCETDSLFLFVLPVRISSSRVLSTIFPFLLMGINKTRWWLCVLLFLRERLTFSLRFCYCEIPIETNIYYFSWLSSHSNIFVTKNVFLVVHVNFNSKQYSAKKLFHDTHFLVF